jgi:ATP-dependent DNA helicase RecG
MALPSWANEEFSKSLPTIRKAGEGQTAEFKEEFPQQGHNLCTEVAAFASSGGGIILIGVCNNGDVKGLDGTTEEVRDGLLHRAQSLVAGIQPSVAYQMMIGHDGGCILGILVEKEQSEPVFYYQQRPYVRDGRTSRPATPNEVKELVWSHSSSEHKRQMEELQYRILVDNHEGLKRLDDQAATASAESMRTLLRMG